MKVRQLIAELKKMPQNAEVVIQDHDHAEDEMNCSVCDVCDVSHTGLSERYNGPVVAIHG